MHGSEIHQIQIIVTSGGWRGPGLGVGGYWKSFRGYFHVWLLMHGGEYKGFPFIIFCTFMYTWNISQWKMVFAIKDGFLFKIPLRKLQQWQICRLTSMTETFWDVLLISESRHETALDFWKCGLAGFSNHWRNSLRVWNMKYHIANNLEGYNLSGSKNR